MENNGTNCDFSILRGIRHSNDLLEEQNYNSVIKDLGIDLKVFHMLPNKEFSHVSSSLIRELETFDEDKIRMYLNF